MHTEIVTKKMLPTKAAGNMALVIAFLALLILAAGACLAQDDPSAHIHVRNHTSHHLRVFIDNMYQGECDAGTDDLRFDVPPGTHFIRGTEEHGREQASRMITVTAGERYRWTVYDGRDENDDE